MRTPLMTLMVAAVVALGVAVAGLFIGRGFVAARTGDRFVTVKGVADREVKADLALWPMRFVATSSQLAEAQHKIGSDTATVRTFLAANGVPASAVEVRSLQVHDLLAQPYRWRPSKAASSSRRP